MSLAYFLYITLCHPQPIPVENLLVEDLSDGDARMGGSFKTAISRLGTGEYNTFCSIVMSCNWEKPIFKDFLQFIVAIQTQHCVALVKGARSPGGSVLMHLQII